MVVGVLKLTLHIPYAASLKEKRHALRKIVDRVRAKFNVSCSEVADQDLWQRAVVGVACVSNDHSFVNQQLDKVVSEVERTAVAEILDRQMEIETFSELHP
jgi:uncharacterized protein